VRVTVALENRFLRACDGNIYSTTVCDYSFWRRYLQVFDAVQVFARVAEDSQAQPERSPANGPGVTFLPLPCFVGPWQYLKEYNRLNVLAKQAVQPTGAYILRVPGTASTLLWHHLRRQRIPYGVEVVGDPWDSFAPGGVQTVLRPMIRRTARKTLSRQCRYASTAAYVTEFTLQRRYFAGGWSTYYSSIELPDEAIITPAGLDACLARTKRAVEGKRPVEICHMGTMAVSYKGQDILIEAVSLCRKKGLDIRLTLLGEGRYFQYYLSKVKELGLVGWVDLLGQVPFGEAVRGQLDKADLFVLPSITEGLPRSLIEAMARGLPCIATRVGGIPELIQEENLVRAGDPGQLARKIAAVVRDQEGLVKMARRNLEIAKKYRSEELHRRRVEMYRKLREITEDWCSRAR
jgi:glycosyltransferase involved in cell wall biosynthesis